MSLRILIADDHEMVREGLKALIENLADMMVVAEASTGFEAVRLAHEFHPDVIIMDIAMPEMNGIEATRRIVAELPEIRILALSMEDDRRFIVEVLRAGASGYLLKHSAFAELTKAIRIVAAGETYLMPRIAEVLLKEFLQRIPEDVSVGYSRLSPRELEILQMIADGKSVKEIAYTFKVSMKTVDNQRYSIMKKLNLFNVAELTKFAIREGLTSLRAETPPPGN
jgi:DNA-binding NarL/FixJ family response regulator